MDLNSLRELALSGCKWELEETPTNCTNQAAPNKQTDDETKSESKISTKQSIIPASAPMPIDSAIDIANGINNTQELMDAIDKFNHPLKQFVKNVVMPHIANGELLIITDMPSNEDEENGNILTNGSGALMDKMLSAIELSRENVSIIPLLFWRTPGGRTPSRDELDLARPIINRAIQLLKPRAILTLGTLTATEIVNAKLPREHGEVFNLGDETPVIPIFHPNYLMLKPDAKRDAWNALQKLQNILKNPTKPL